MYVKKDLVFIVDSLKDQDELFDFMADHLEELQCVTTEYRNGVKQREKQFPTGLKLEGLNIAIAHTESKYSLKNRILGMKMENPVEFVNAENGEKLPVNFVLGLIFKSGDKHLSILKKVASLFQNKEVIEKIKKADTEEELFLILSELFNEE